VLTYDDEMENKAHVGCLCFLQSHSSSFPPHFYQQIPRWVDVLFCLSPLSLLLLLLVTISRYIVSR
jgi:hypothetical protein